MRASTKTAIGILVAIIAAVVIGEMLDAPAVPTALGVAVAFSAIYAFRRWSSHTPAWYLPFSKGLMIGGWAALGIALFLAVVAAL